MLLPMKRRKIVIKRHSTLGFCEKCFFFAYSLCCGVLDVSAAPFGQGQTHVHLNKYSFYFSFSVYYSHRKYLYVIDIFYNNYLNIQIKLQEAVHILEKAVQIDNSNNDINKMLIDAKNRLYNGSFSQGK